MAVILYLITKHTTKAIRHPALILRAKQNADSFIITPIEDNMKEIH
jgi:hypothetical protein